MFSVLCVQYVCTLYIHALQQLPVTIPKLAQLSPCQSSDGKIYTGVYVYEYIRMYVRTCHMLQALLVFACVLHAPLLPAHKKDEWIAVDPRSGAKLYTVSSAGVNSYCPADGSGEDAILLGKSSELHAHFVCCMQCRHVEAVVGRVEKHAVTWMEGGGVVSVPAQYLWVATY